MKYKIRHTYCRSGNLHTATMTFCRSVFDTKEAAQAKLETIRQNIENRGYTEYHYMWNQEKDSISCIHTALTATGYDYVVEEYSIVGRNR